MQTLGMFHADECVYTFETGTELLRIPRLPIRLDEGCAVATNLTAFRKLVVWGELPAQECADIPETLLFQAGNRCTLSVWGRLSWDQCRTDLLGRRLLDPISARVRWSPNFASTPLDGQLMARPNAQLGRLCRCGDSGGTRSAADPSSLDFKQLAAPRGASTHECDAFGGSDGRRLYGHNDGEAYVVDEMGEHL